MNATVRIPVDTHDSMSDKITTAKRGAQAKIAGFMRSLHEGSAWGESPSPRTWDATIIMDTNPDPDMLAEVGFMIDIDPHALTVSAIVDPGAYHIDLNLARDMGLFDGEPIHSEPVTLTPYEVSLLLGGYLLPSSYREALIAGSGLTRI